MTIQQHFYQGTHLHTLKSRDQTTSLFRHQDMPLAERRGANPVGLLGTDMSRSVLHSLKAALPSNLSYTPYGHTPNGAEATSSLGFNGEHRDPLGLYLLGNGYRAYNPVLMRFHSPDSMSPFGRGGLNVYAYCEGDPINRRDPTGHFIAQVIVALIVFVIVVVLAVAGILKLIRDKKFGYSTPLFGKSRIRKG